MTRRLLVIGSCVCVALTVATYIVAFKSNAGRRFDARTLGASGGRESIPAIREAAGAVVDTIDIGSVLLVGGAAVASVTARNRRDLALAVGVLLAAALTTTELLKPLLRTWDVFGGDAFREAHGFFPSGHATVAMSSAFALVLASPRRWKRAAGLLGGLYAAAAGVSLVLEGSHYPSDVVGGFLLTGAWCGLVVAVVQGHGLPPAPARPRRTSAAVGGLVAAYTLVALALALALGTHSSALHHVQRHAPVAAATMTIAALALALTGALAALLQAGGPD